MNRIGLAVSLTCFVMAIAMYLMVGCTCLIGGVYNREVYVDVETTDNISVDAATGDIGLPNIGR